jgi:hypothetical protein
MKKPEMNLPIKKIVMAAIDRKTTQLLLHISDHLKVKRFDAKNITIGTIKEKKILEIKMFYKGDEWLVCQQVMGANGIEEINFKSKYIS